jgi:hypothetical protein
MQFLAERNQRFRRISSFPETILLSGLTSGKFSETFRRCGMHSIKINEKTFDNEVREIGFHQLGGVL